MAGAQAVDAKNHFDVEVICVGPFKRPPQSCFLDGMQLGSGATLGKRTIEVVEAKQLVVKIRNSRTKKAVEVRPTRKLLDILEPPAQTEGGKHDEGLLRADCPRHCRDARRGNTRDRRRQVISRPNRAHDKRGHGTQRPITAAGRAPESWRCGGRRAAAESRRLASSRGAGRSRRSRPSLSGRCIPPHARQAD